ncbi:MAG: hypothetical protein WD042_02130 [Phycisphaeraceae bacterium]
MEMTSLTTRLRPMLPGLLLALLANLYGVGLGITFGLNEDAIKTHLKTQGQAVLATAYNNNQAKLDGVLDKSWTYFKRAHLHANGLGTTAVALILLLAVLPGGGRINAGTALALGTGALGYAVYWMVAGLRAPGLGSTGAAKDNLTWLAMPTSGLFALGLAIVIVQVLVAMLRPKAAA